MGKGSNLDYNMTDRDRKTGRYTDIEREIEGEGSNLDNHK